MGILQVKILEWVAIPPGDHSNPGIEPRSPALQADSLPSEPLGKSKNAEVDSLSLLHGIFPPQESTCVSSLQADSLLAGLLQKSVQQPLVGAYSGEG